MHCPRCNGSGQCPDCKGQGFQECPACDGSGQRSTSRGHTYACKACQGEGKTACPTACPACEGSGEITEALQKKVQEQRILKFDNLTPSSRVTSGILVTTIVMFLLQKGVPEVPVTLMLRTDVFLTHHYWQFLGPVFLHVNFIHLFCNMWFLRTYGPVLEGMLGRSRFLGLYLFAGFTGCLLSWLGNCLIQGQYWAGMGASGALFGFVGALLAIYLRWRMVSWESIRSLSTWSGIILLGGFALDASGFSLIDNWAHLGGLIGGFLLTAVLPRPRGH